MKISAVIPAYNSAAYINDAITSIHEQTHPIDEIIIIDDGSTDNTCEVVQRSKGNIIYIKQENQGPSAARNHGIKAASGDWIAFLDADDQWTPDKTKEQLITLKKYPKLRLIASDMAEIADSNIITPSVLNKHHLSDFFQKLGGKPIPNALAALMEKNFIPTGTVLVKRTTLFESGLFNPEIRFGEDLELWAKIAAHTPITCLAQVHMLRRQHGDNATQSTFPMLTDLVKVCESIRHWDSDALVAQGINPNKLVARAWADLGYWHFASGNQKLARKSFQSSLCEHFTKRAFFYGIASILPAALSNGMKHTKQLLRRSKQ